MSLPILLTSDMLGAPGFTPTNGSLNALLNACLVNGFNTQSVTSATANGGVVTFNFASAPGFSELSTVTIAGASNATVNGQKRVQSAVSNQVLVAIPGVPDGAVGGTITLKFSPLGWTRPYSGTNIGVYRQGGTASHKRYLRVYDHNVAAANYVAYARGYESMTAVSTGTGPFPTVAQVAGNGAGAAFPYDYTADAPATQYRTWVLLGTPRFFILYAQTNGVIYGTGMTAAPPLASALHTQAQCFAFGELADVTKAADAYAVALWPQNAMHTPYVARNVNGAGSAGVMTLIGPGSRQNHSWGAMWPSASDGGIHFMGAPHYTDDATPYGHRGSLPGALMTMEAPFYAPTATPATLGQIVTSVGGVTGRVMLLASSQAFTDMGWKLDEDWGDT